MTKTNILVRRKILLGVFLAAILLSIAIFPAATSSTSKTEEKISPLYKIRIFQNVKEKIHFPMKVKYLIKDRILIGSQLRFTLPQIFPLKPRTRTCSKPTVDCPFTYCGGKLCNN